MERFNKLFICVILFGCSVVFGTEKPKCTSQHEELWPHPNPNNYWYCHHEGSDPIERICPANRGFLRKQESSGCVPYIEWQCTEKSSKPSCRSNAEYNKPHRHPNPNKFWACPEPQGTPATELNCPPGRGFVDNTKNLGCVPFERTTSNPDEWVCAEAGNKNRE